MSRMRFLALSVLLLAVGCAEEGSGSLIADTDNTTPAPAGDGTSATPPGPSGSDAKDTPASSPSSSSDAPRDATAPKAGATPAGTPPDELHEVKKGLWRGAHPNRTGLEHVKSLGVKTILSLQQPDGSKIEGDVAEEVAQEQKDAKDLGLEYISVPMSSWSNAAEYDAAWTKVKPVLAKDGVYVHCEHGHDRTGLVIALERVFVEKKSPDEAHTEWKNLGHSSLLFRMDSYFDEKTNP